MEFVVVDSTAVYDCTGSAPPYIDIRSWIIDDNSGYGSWELLPEHVAFLDPLWSCVPLNHNSDIQ